MKYKMKALTMLLGGKVYEKSDNTVFDTIAQPHLASALEQAEKAGFVEAIIETETPKKAVKK